MKNKTVRLVWCIACTFLFSGCGLVARKPQVASQIKEAVPLNTAVSATDNAVKTADDSTAALGRKEKERAGAVLANVNAARTANQDNPEGTPKENVDTELSVAQTRLSDVQENPVEAAAAATRRAAFAAGRVAEARQSADKSSGAAKAAIVELGEAKAAAEAALRARDEARAAEAKARTDFVQLTERNRVENERAIQEALDSERKKTNRIITYILMGGSVLAILIGAFLVYSNIQTGNIPKAILVGVVFGGAAAFASVCAWTINQWWFKYVVWSGLAAGVIAAIFFIQSELRDAKQKKTRAKEADEAEDTLKRVMHTLDKSLPESSEIFTKLGGEMSDAHKALLHELRAEDKRQKAAAV